MEDEKKENVEVTQEAVTSDNDVIAKKSKAPVGIIAAIVAVIAIIGVFVMVNAGGKSSNGLQEQLDLGAKYLSELDYESAIASFEAAIVIDPYCEDAYVGIADAYIAMGDAEISGTDIALEAYEVAESDYNKALEWLSKSTEYFESDNINSYIEAITGKIEEVNAAIEALNSVTEDVTEEDQTEEIEVADEDIENINDEDAEVTEDEETVDADEEEIEGIAEEEAEIPEESVEPERLIDPHGFEFASREQLANYIYGSNFYCENCGSLLRGASRVEGYASVEDFGDGQGPHEVLRFDLADGGYECYDEKPGTLHKDICPSCGYELIEVLVDGEFFRCDNWDTYDWAKSIGI